MIAYGSNFMLTAVESSMRQGKGSPLVHNYNAIFGFCISLTPDGEATLEVRV
jgi:hypothetical protein